MKLIVYGTLKKGFHANNLLGDSKYLGSFREELPYQMFDLGSFPALVASETTAPISFEMYKVDKKTMETLDRYEGYPNLYTKDIVLVHGMEATIYVMKDNVFRNKKPMEDGNWTKNY